MDPVLVVGGAGYIGSHACKALRRSGYLPICYDNLSRGHSDLVKWGPLEKGGIEERERIDLVLKRAKPVAVMHFAALSEVGESVKFPDLFYRNNVVGTLALLEAMRENGVGTMIFSSTCSTYGLPESIPITENMPQNPINPYGRTKLAVEWMLRDFASAFALKWMSLRYFNACGADPDGETGERHHPETHLIPRTLMAATGSISELTLFGTDYPTPDGTCIRDYIHATDLADAHVTGMQYLLGGGENIALNLGTGAGFSVRQIIETVEVVTGCKVPIREAARRLGDPPVLVSDPSLARRILGFSCPTSGLERIVETAWNWHRKDLHTARNGVRSA